jgi:hypothetical protein
MFDEALGLTTVDKARTPLQPRFAVTHTQDGCRRSKKSGHRGAKAWDVLVEGNRDKETVGITGSSKPPSARQPNRRRPRGIVGMSLECYDNKSGAMAPRR